VLTLEQVMSKDIYSLRKHDTLQDARLLMLARHIHHVPILDKAGGLVGMVSQRDILAVSHSSQLSESDLDLETQNKIKLAAIMSTEIETMAHDDTLLAAGQSLLKNKYGCIPVEKDGKLVGLVTTFDFIKMTVTYLEGDLNTV